MNQAFAAVADQGHHFARPAREIYWKNTDSTYWIQWTAKDDAAMLWAFDPETNEAVEVLRVHD